MIRVSKIAHASYETPDLDKQTEYYTDILGLDASRPRRRTRSISPRRSIIIRSCCAKARRRNACASAFQISPDADLGEFEKQVAGHGIKTERRKDPEPSISDMLVFADPEGHGHGGVQARRLSRTRNSRPRASCRTSSATSPSTSPTSSTSPSSIATCSAFANPTGWRDFFSFLRCGPDHHTINLMQTGSNRHFHTAFELRDWGHMQTACDYPQRQRLQAAVGTGPARHRP